MPRKPAPLLFSFFYCTGQEKSIRDEGLARLKPLIGQYPVILLSEESIWNDRRMNTEAFLALRSDLEGMGARLKVIAYVRRQDLVMPSYWAQLVKNRLTMTFDEFISSREYKRYRLYYDRRLGEIDAAIGAENILVRPFEKRQFEVYDRPAASSAHTAHTGAVPVGTVSPSTDAADQPEKLLSICSDLLLLQNARIEKLETELRASRNNSLKKRCARKLRRIIPASFRPQKS